MPARGWSAFGGKKLLILVLGLSLTAASCDFGALLDLGGGGARGVIKSEDNGESFRSMNLLGTKSNINSITANSLALDPSNPDNVYMAASGGMYKSENGAKSWRYILSGISVADIAVDPNQPNIVYAAGIVGSNGKIIKSMDGGASWVDVYTEPSKNNTVLAIAVSRNNSSLVLAGLNSGEIIRSSDAGHTWQISRDLADQIIRIKFGVSGTAYALTARKGVWKSQDQGGGWDSISNTLSSDTLNSSNQSPASVTIFYDLVLDQRQPGVLYLGTQQGLFRSVNDGSSWSFMGLPVKNSSLRVSAVAVNPNNSNNIFAAVSSTIFKSVNGGVTWESRVLPTGAGIRSILINPQANNTIYLGMGPSQ